MPSLRRLLFLLLLALPLVGCPESNDDDSVAPPDDDDDDGESCDEDTDCNRFDDGLEICDLAAAVCIEGDRNNSRDESQLLAYDSTASLYIAPAGDVDWFRFNGTEGDMLLISTTAEEPNALDTVVVYMDSQGNQIGFNDDFDRVGSIPPDSRLYVGVPSTGTFYISVQDRRSWANDPNDPPDGGDDFEYSVTLARAGAGSNVPVVSEPNDSLGEAYDWGVEQYSVNYSLGGQFESAGDQDFVRIPVLTGEILRLYGFPNTGTSARPAVTVLMPDQVTPIRRYTGLNWTAEGRAYLPVLEDGDYYLQIEDDNGTGGFDHWFYMHGAKNEPAEDFVAEVEPNDSENPGSLGFVSATAGNTTIWGRIGAPADEDHFSFEGNAGERVTVFFDVSGHGETTNPVASLIGPDGEVFATGTWSGDPKVPALQLETLDVSGAWRVMISEEDPLVGGGGKYYVTTITLAP
ncbi:MAG: hypothetical protein KDA24_12600 [Deltaproteobacteria bacterium]|nr:hypothetical protein [Deltaproteobacteria bacterium]